MLGQRDGSMCLIKSWQCLIMAEVAVSSCVDERTVLNVWNKKCVSDMQDV